MDRRFNPVSLQQAADDSSTLAGLASRARDATARLEAVADLIPPEMRTVVQAGPVEGAAWCLLVQGSAAAAKLRQLPLLQHRLESRGWAGATLRIKVLGGRR